MLCLRFATKDDLSKSRSRNSSSASNCAQDQRPFFLRKNGLGRILASEGPFLVAS